MGQELSRAISEELAAPEQQQQQPQPQPYTWEAMRKVLAFTERAPDPPERPTPAAERASPPSYVPDYLTGFAQEQSRIRHQENNEKAWVGGLVREGRHSVGVDSLQMVEERKIQQAVSDAHSKGRRHSDERPYSVPSDVDKRWQPPWLHARMEEVRDRDKRTSAGMSTSDIAPSVGADAFLLQQSKQVEKRDGVRNALVRGGASGKPKNIGKDSFMTVAAKEAAKWAPGIKSKRDWMGVRPVGVTTQDAQMAFARSSQPLVSNAKAPGLFNQGPKERQAFQGIKPHTTADDFVLSRIRKEKKAIHDAEVQQPSIIPSIPTDAFLIGHAKSVAAEVQQAKRTRWPFSAGGRKRPGKGPGAFTYGSTTQARAAWKSGRLPTGAAQEEEEEGGENGFTPGQQEVVSNTSNWVEEAAAVEEKAAADAVADEQAAGEEGLLEEAEAATAAAEAEVLLAEFAEDDATPRAGGTREDNTTPRAKSTEEEEAEAEERRQKMVQAFWGAPAPAEEPRTTEPDDGEDDRASSGYVFGF